VVPPKFKPATQTPQPVVTELLRLLFYHKQNILYNISVSDILKATPVPNFVIHLNPEHALSRWHVLSGGEIYPTTFTFNVVIFSPILIDFCGIVKSKIGFSF
jgi:hypothetical protein